MATVQEVLQQDLSDHQIVVDQTRLDRLMVDNNLNGGDEYSMANAKEVKTIILNMLSKLLAMPDVSEGQMSIKWNREGVSTYLGQLRTELGMQTATAEPEATVRNASFLW